MIRPILPWPDPHLATPAVPVETVTDEIRAIWADMIDTMEAMPGHGVGLAANQIGVLLRLAVLDCNETRGAAIRLANPEIVTVSDDLSAHDEASPCLPGVDATITRPARVTLRFLNEQGEPATREFSGLWATSAQHQLDHLAGRMYFDNLSKLKRDRLLKKARKLGAGRCG
ncbi:peptide deformylase [Rhodovulum sp. MB263]|uniref:peptide deformylase n=1 Tax=Rhodovulum sp. (strain MB263) TaxID=308754 RepID=UPI0009B7546D|nr:peptide deformylase [Rhodovulum sp. MB263]ARC87349.1 peptide deformylase [Rhodovulum sp. MB263]